MYKDNQGGNLTMNPEKTHLYKKQYQQPIEEETPPHKGKSKTAATSDSRKRSKHKHIYKKIILHYGSDAFCWGRQCEICGRLDSTYKSSYWNAKEFENFCSDSLASFDEKALEFFASEEFDAVIKEDISRFFRIESERPEKYAHYRGLIDFWIHCEKDRLEHIAKQSSDSSEDNKAKKKIKK